MKKQILLYILFFISIAEATIAHGNLSGAVTDKITDTKLNGASVALKNTSYAAVTDSTGKFIINNIAPGNYNLVVTMQGYLAKSIDINIKDLEETEVQVMLTYSAITLPEQLIKADRPVSAASSMVLNAIDFELRPKSSAQDMLRLVPGLFIAQHAGGGKAEQIFVRGFDCDHGTDVATYVDGIPVNMPSHGHGQGYADLHFLIPEVVKNMEVYKGPYFAKFGDFATGAAVEFNTLDVLEHNQVAIEVGSIPGHSDFASRRGLLMAQLPIDNNKVTSYIAADLYYTPGYFKDNQHFNRYCLFNKTKFKLGDNSSLGISFGGFGSSWNASGQLPERAIESGLVSRFGSLDNTEGGTTQRNNLNLVYNAKNGNKELTSQLYYVNYRFKLFSNFTFFLNDSVNGDEIEQDDYRNILGYNGTYAIRGKLWQMPVITTFGAGFRLDNIENSLWHVKERTRIGVVQHTLVHEKSMYVYVKENIDLTDNLRIELALRHDYFIFDVEDLLSSDSTHNNISGYNYQTGLSPKFNLIWSPSANLHLFLNGGSGFHSNDARVVVQDKEKHILPRAVGSEIGFQYRFGKRVIVSAAFWAMDLTNELVYVGDEGVTEDNGPSRRRGVDVGLRVRFTNWLVFDGDVNIAKSTYLKKFLGDELKDGSLVPLAPKFTSTAGLTVQSLKGFEAGIRYRYMADRPAIEDNSIIAHGYTVFDFNANYHTTKYKISIGIENLLNTQWNEAQFETLTRLNNEPLPVDELAFTPGTPFAFKLGLSYFF